MPELVENDTSFVCRYSSSCARNILFHVLDGGGGHFEYRALAELAVTFERYIGAKLPLKCFRLSHQSRKKVGKEWSWNKK